MQLSKEQRIFILHKFKETANVEHVRREFHLAYPQRDTPHRRTIHRTVEKFNEHGTILNRNKGNSGRRITERTQENIATVRQLITHDPNMSVREAKWKWFINVYILQNFKVRSKFTSL